MAEATGGQIQTTVNNLSPKALGTCARFEERQVGAERYNLFTGGLLFATLASASPWFDGASLLA